MAESVKISEAIASLIWQVVSAGEPVEPALFRNWLGAYHLARVQEDLPELFTLTGHVELSDADWPSTYEDLCGSNPDGKPEAPAAPKAPGPWSKRKQRIAARLDLALGEGVTRAQLAEASGGTLGLQDVMDMVERKTVPVAKWEALDNALKKLEGGAANAAADCV